VALVLLPDGLRWPRPPRPPEGCSPRRTSPAVAATSVSRSGSAPTGSGDDAVEASFGVSGGGGRSR
jgi:hypothetical protein